MPFRVLVVDDYEPFRRVVRSILKLRNDLQVIGEASDGREAIEKAKVLRPDLVLLDIALPTLNGIQVARRLRDLHRSPQILFLSVESSSDVIREALNVGGSGYVHKLHVGSELLSAIDSILGGTRFIGSGLKSESDAGTGAPHNHEMFIYSDEAVLVESFTRFITNALRAGNPAIVVVTKSHLDALLHSLSETGVDIASAIDKGTFVPLEVTEILGKFMAGDLPDPIRFMNVVTDLFRAALKAAGGVNRRIAACGECSPTLWVEGKMHAAVWLEELWDNVAHEHEADILCAYAASNFHQGKDGPAFMTICGEHSAVHSR